MNTINASAKAPLSSHYGALLVVTLAGLLIVRIAALAFSGTELFFDEAQYWVWSTEPAIGYFSKPPLIAWTIAAFGQLCGDTEFCIRLASPVLYALTAGAVYFAASALYGARIGFWSAFVFATLPGISFSAGLISTDVPLLLCWALALLAWIKLQEQRSWKWAGLLGGAIGFGLLAKYAMIYFLGCAFVAMAVHRQSRWLARDMKGLLVVLLAAVIILPNIVWNFDNGWITFGHTAANANWSGSFIKPLKMLEFIGSQFGVFGPIMMAALIAICVGAWRNGASDHELLLLSFSLPVIALITVQALLSRALANWAATAYPAATILVTAMLINGDYRRLFASTVALHLSVLAVLAGTSIYAANLALPGRADPFSRVLGWRDTAHAVSETLEKHEIGAVLTEDRLVTAELLYYLRAAPAQIRSWRPGAVPRDHFEFSRPFTEDNEQPVLLVSLRQNTRHVSDHFTSAVSLESRQVNAGPKTQRTIYFTVLNGFKGQ